MKHWITPDGNYYFGLFVAEGSIEIDGPPPSPEHIWQGGEWLFIPQVPQEVSMRQGREALLRRGHFDTVNNYISGLTGTAGQIARNEWEKSQVIQRTRPLTLQMGQLLGLDDAGLDDLFIFAATL